MAIHSTKNLYPGINPHLNSALIKNFSWRGFHNTYLVKLCEALDQVMPPQYYTIPEESFQARTYDFAVESIQDYEDNVVSAVIYRWHEGTGENRDTPLTRIEMLTPACKPRGTLYEDYLLKRAKWIERGLPLIELDFLPAQPPILSEIPDYTNRDFNSYPYYIITTNPSLEMNIVGIGGMEPLPLITVQLEGDDTASVDLNELYQTIFTGFRYYYEISTDYAQEPTNFAAYNEADQQAIRAHMAKIAAENAP